MTPSARPAVRAALVDVGLAVGGLLVVAATAAALGVAAAPLAGGVGGVATVVLEALLVRDREAVRDVWARQSVKLLAGAVFVALVGAATVAAPSRGLSALAGGLLAYLGLLAWRWVWLALQ